MEIKELNRPFINKMNKVVEKYNEQLYQHLLKVTNNKIIAEDYFEPKLEVVQNENDLDIHYETFSGEQNLYKICVQVGEKNHDYCKLEKDFVNNLFDNCVKDLTKEIKKLKMLSEDSINFTTSDYSQDF